MNQADFVFSGMQELEKEYQVFAAIVRKNNGNLNAACADAFGDARISPRTFLDLRSKVIALEEMKFAREFVLEAMKCTEA